MARGRAPNLSLPPTRQLSNQRDYRARKVQYITGLEEKVKALEQRVTDLEQELSQAKLGAGGGMSSKEASELRAALLQSLNLVNQAYPPRASSSFSANSPAPLQLAARTPSSSYSAPPPPNAQLVYSNAQHQSEAGPSNYFSNPPSHPYGASSSSLSPSFATPPFPEREQRGSMSSSHSHEVPSSLASPVVVDSKCCDGLFDCSPFPPSNSFETTPPLNSGHTHAPLPQPTQQHAPPLPQPTSCRPSSSCCPPIPQPALQSQPQNPPPSQPRPQPFLHHPLLLLAQTSVMGTEQPCCDVETAMRDGCTPTREGGWARVVGVPLAQRQQPQPGYQ